MSSLETAIKQELVAQTIKLNIGCGPTPKEGWVGIDSIDFKHNLVVNIGSRHWRTLCNHHILQESAYINEEGSRAFPDNCVEEAQCHHVLEHLTNFNERWERVNFWNELHRIMIKGAKLSLVVPHWASNRYYGDPTHKEPWSEMAFYYLDRNWRKANAPHADIEHNPNGYSCDWEFTVSYSIHQDLVLKNAELQRFALQNYKEAALDMISTLTVRKD